MICFDLIKVGLYSLSYDLKTLKMVFWLPD